MIDHEHEWQQLLDGTEQCAHCTATRMSVHHAVIREQTRTLATLRSEVARLRAALEDVVRFADVVPPGIIDRARAALDGDR